MFLLRVCRRVIPTVSGHPHPKMSQRIININMNLHLLVRNDTINRIRDGTVMTRRILHYLAMSIIRLKRNHSQPIRRQITINLSMLSNITTLPTHILARRTMRQILRQIGHHMPNSVLPRHMATRRRRKLINTMITRGLNTRDTRRDNLLLKALMVSNRRIIRMRDLIRARRRHRRLRTTRRRDPPNHDTTRRFVRNRPHRHRGRHGRLTNTMKQMPPLRGQRRRR